MKIKRLRLRNFRCFKDEIAIDFDDITAFVGKNDSGKSTIMDALDLFLNEKNPDKDDASKDGDPKDLTIICEFDDLPDEVILDDQSPTTFGNEYLLNAEGRLEIHKCYSGELKTPKCKSIEAYSIHPTIDGAKDLLQLKNTDLKKRAEELGVNLDDVDQRSNVQLRAQIRDSFGDLQPGSSMIPLNDDNAKKIWTEIRKYLPAFALFKSDRASTDQDAEAQDPLKAAVKEAIRDKEAELGAITDYVLSKVQEIADLTLKKIREMDPALATQLNPQFSAQKWDGLFKTSLTADDDIPINKRGSGVKRLILLNFFRAKAEQLAKEKGHSFVIYAVEEPETSQHPNNQRMLVRTLSDLSSEAQVIISTHTPMLARVLPDTTLRYIHVHEDKRREIMVGEEATNATFAQALGVLPDNNVKLFIGVEGPNDIMFLNTMSKALRDDGVDIPDLGKMELDGKLIFFPLGGSNLARWSSRLANLNRPEFHLCDRSCVPPDPPVYQDHVDQVNAREKCRARSTEKLEIENYLHYEAIVAAYADLGIDLPITTNYGPYDDVPMEVARLVHEASSSEKVWDALSGENKDKKESRVKSVLCKFAPTYMNRTLLGEIDPGNDLLEWFQDIIELCEPD
jgi:putative ATP-dependent endonuclease of OLD family